MLSNNTFASAFCARSGNFGKIAFYQLRRQAAQTVIGAQFNYHDIRFVQGQSLVYTRQTAGRGIAADAFIVDNIVTVLFHSVFSAITPPSLV